MRFHRVAVAGALLVASMTAARAAVVISGETMFFTGAGSYTLNIFATAEDNAEEIGGFNLTLDFSDPNLTFSSASFNPVFESVLINDVGSNVGLQGSDLEFMPLAIALNETVSLASVTINASGMGTVPITPVEVNDANFTPIAQVRVDQRAPSLAVTAIPEPSSSVALAALGVIAVAFGRYRKREA